MAVVNPMFNLANVKDSRWLTLEVCREFQRNKCTRTELECKFAHPPPHVEVQNGRVTCCFDSIKGKCQRKDPPCKYLHPPQHLREQLLQNGRNNLILKNLQMQAMAAGGLPAQPMVPGMIPTVMYDASGKPVSYPTSVIHGQYPSLVSSASQSCLPGQFEHFWDLPGYQQANPYMTIGNAGFNPYISTSVPGAVSMIPTADGSSVIHTGGQLQGVMQGGGSSAAAAAAAAAKQPRADRLEGMTAVPGMVPYVKRTAVADSKSGVPMYQPGSGTATYQQALAMQQQLQQHYVPVTSAGLFSGTGHHGGQMSYGFSTVAGHPPSVPRF